ncbi:hypothetical protein ETB97_008633 [Aspergillus alliaceus]|uniref:Uncharacterized protein n=1 Tax=Petromyces alliaceus TaxID=209559 RepID=A0A8H6AF86_PETAA|nr:hypothetical protein ETB97_008633 [Aspergillus burnettii]
MLVISLPQRFQTVNSLSALHAGVRLLPHVTLAPIGSLSSNIIFMRRPVLLFLVAGAGFQLVGLALLDSESVSTTLVTIRPPSVSSREIQPRRRGDDLSFRPIGGAIGLSIKFFPAQQLP